MEKKKMRPRRGCKLAFGITVNGVVAPCTYSPSANAIERLSARCYYRRCGGTFYLLSLRAR